MDHLNTVIEDIEANLENLKEQRTVIEHVAEKLARLDFALQRAEAATRELREERALAARIYKNDAGEISPHGLRSCQGDSSKAKMNAAFAARPIRPILSQPKAIKSIAFTNICPRTSVIWF